MTEAEADALKMLSKMTEAAEGTMMTEVRAGALMKLEGYLKTAEEAHKRLEILLEKLKLMESEAGAVIASSYLLWRWLQKRRRRNCEI